MKTQMNKELSPREREALILRANGNTNTQAARWMGITEQTLTTLLARCYRKLGVSNATQAVAVGIAVGEIGIHQIHIPSEQEEPAA